MCAVRNVYANVVAGAHQAVPAPWSQPVEHLELEALRRDAALLRKPDHVRDQLFVVGSDSRVGRALEKQSGALAKVLANVRHALEREVVRLLVRPLAQSHPVALPDALLHVVLGAVQVRLEHDPDVVVVLAELAEHSQRRVRVLRSFHVEAHEPPGSRATSRTSEVSSMQSSSEMSSPIIESLMETLRSTSGGIARSSFTISAESARACRGSATSSPNRSNVARIFRCQSRAPASTAEAAESPATKRRARIAGSLTTSGPSAAQERGRLCGPARALRRSRRPAASASAPERVG